MIDTSQLHLPDLAIRGFRGIEELSIPRLGRVTLLAGKNSVGKTTVLEAVRVYAERGRYSALNSLLRKREEMIATTDEDGDSILAPDWRALFHGRDVSQDTPITIGPSNQGERLTIATTSLTDEQLHYLDPMSDFVPTKVLQATYGGKRQVLPMTIASKSGARFGYGTTLLRRMPLQFSEDEPWPAVENEFMGPGLLDNSDLARLWDGVALTDDEDRAVSALGLVFGADVERVAVVGDDSGFTSRSERRVMVRLKGDNQPIPLKSLGDGALRLFGVALALANSRGGFLLVDESENGIHHSVQRDYWRMIMRTAQENNVQVLATTHSWDCVTGFAQAASEVDEVEGVLVRLSRSNGELRAVEYPEEELAIAAEQGIEVR